MLFEKTRSKRRRPFTRAEDRALKAGYEKHGTRWAIIVKDPIFAEQNRRSTDLRDRFRNAFPDLYQAAGYKARSASKKKLLLDGMVVGRAADDDQLSTTAGPVRSRRRAKTSQELLRGGTKSVPESTVCSEDEESESSQAFKTPPMFVFVENVSIATYRPPTKRSQTTTTTTTTVSTTSNMPTLSSTADTQVMDPDNEMELLTLDSTDALNIPDFLPNNVHSDMEMWSSGLSTPTHSSTTAWSTAAVSPTSSHLSDFFINATAASTTSSASSPSIQSGSNSFSGGNGNGTGIDNNFGMIGKSAWGTDWFSPNPRLDATSGTSSNSNSTSSSFMDLAKISPASPFSFQGHLNHGVLDRYDLFPPYMPDGNVSEAGEMGGGGSAGNGAGASSGGTGFKGYHSQIAGDLISGDGMRMHHHHSTHHNNHHQHNHQSTAFSLSSLYGTSFGSAFGNPATADGGASSSSSVGLGLGLEGIPENVNVSGIHPMQLHSHAHSSSSLDLGVVREVGSGEGVGEGVSSSAGRGPVDDDAMDEGEEGQHQPSQVQVQEKWEGGGGGGDIGASSASVSSTSAAASAAGTIVDRRPNEPDMSKEDISSLPFQMEDFMDMNELYVTPPKTPLVTQPRPMRRLPELRLGGFEGGFGLGGFSGVGGVSSGVAAGGNGGGGAGGGGNGGTGGGHARSISVPPSEAAQNGHHMHDVDVPMSMDDVGLHSMHLGLLYHRFGEVEMGGLHSVFGAATASGSTEDPRFQERQSRTVDPQRLSGSGAGVGVVHSPTSPSGISLHRQQHQHQQHQHQHHQQQNTQLNVDDNDDNQHQHTSELTPLFPVSLILSPAAAATFISLPSSSSQSEHAHAHTHPNGASAGGESGHHTPVINHRHTPIIDHRHTPAIDSHRHTPAIDHDHDQQRDKLWCSASSESSLGLTFSSFSAFSGDYNLPFLDLHYYGGAGSPMFGSSNHRQMNPHHPNHLHLLHSHSHPHHGHPHPHQHLHNTLGLDVTSIDDFYSSMTAGMTMEATRQGLALDLAQTNAQMGSFGVGNGLGNNHHMATGNPNATNPNLALGSLARFQRTPLPSGTIWLHQPQQQRRKSLLGETFSPPDQGVDVVSSNANANVHSKGNEDGGRCRLSDSNDPGNSNGTNTSNNTSPSESMNWSSSDDSRTGGGRATTRVRKSMTAGIKSLTNAVCATPAATTTITTTTMPTTTTTIGRLLSHHREQSAASAAASSSVSSGFDAPEWGYA